MNRKPLAYTTCAGVVFTAPRADFLDGVVISGAANLSPEELAAATAEFIWWHVTEVYPQLQGFFGYDSVPFKMAPPEK